MPVKNSRRGLVFAAWIAFVAIALPFGARAQIAGSPLESARGIQRTTGEIMALQAARPAHRRAIPELDLDYPDRSQLGANPGAPATSRLPTTEEAAPVAPELAIHTPGSAFDGATLSDTLAFPPDSMGAVGPGQFVVFVNGRLRTFTRAGTADGVLNVDPDVFFSSVMTPVAGSVVLNFSSDPQVRFDRQTGRWFLSIIDVPCLNAFCSSLAANRWLLAVSDATSAGTISNSTVWTFFQVQTDATNFCDYPSLGVDANALYVGCNVFSSAGGWVGTKGLVVRKSTVLGAGPMTTTAFTLVTGTGSGPYSPRGVDNADAAATEGYFVGVDNAVFSKLDVRRVSSPGSASPTISSDLAITVSTTTFPNPVEHAGNTGGNNGRLDSIDDRLFAAAMRGGRLWTAHNIRVGANGVASTGAAARNAVRWYELQNLASTPAVVQSGTIYDSAALLADARQYFIPSIAVTGQGHAVAAFTMAGAPVGATPAFTGRLSGSTLGTMAGPPGSAATTFGTSAASYNPPSDPGGSRGRRWGDYSATMVDPLDDMTIWTIQEYNQATNSYAVRVGRLAAPPPAALDCASTPVEFEGSEGDVVITGTASGGAGFYDPGADPAPPALGFHHLAALVPGATVESVTYQSPTQLTLHLSGATPGLHDVTITNPDGQSVTVADCLDVVDSLGDLIFKDGFESGDPSAWSFTMN